MSQDQTTVERLAEAQRELQSIATDLFQARSSKRSDREDHGRRLNAVSASLRTVEHLLRAGPVERNPIQGNLNNVTREARDGR